MQEHGLERIDPDSRTIETSNGYCVVISGKHKGIAFIKSEHGKREIPFNELPFELKKQYNDYYSDTDTRNPHELWEKSY